MVDRQEGAELRIDDLDAFYDRFAPVIYGVATAVTDDRSLACAIAAEALVDVWTHAAQDAIPDQNVMAWVVSLTHTTGVRRVREQSTREPATTPGGRDAVTLAYLGYTYSEIATILDLTEDETLARLRRDLRSRATLTTAGVRRRDERDTLAL